MTAPKAICVDLVLQLDNIEISFESVDIDDVIPMSSSSILYRMKACGTVLF